MIEQPKQIVRLHQAAGGIVADEEFLAIEFSAAIDEGRDAGGDRIAAEIMIVEHASEIVFLQLGDRRDRRAVNMRQAWQAVNPGKSAP